MAIVRMSAAGMASASQRSRAAVMVFVVLLSVLLLPAQVSSNIQGPGTTSDEPAECNACLHVKSEQAAQVGDAYILDSDLGNEYDSMGNWTINANASTLSLFPTSTTIVAVRYEIAFPNDCCTATEATWELRGKAGYMEPWVSLHNVTNHRIAPGRRLSFPLCIAPLQPFEEYDLRVEVADGSGGVIKISDVKLFHQYCNVSAATTITGIVPHMLERAGEVMIYGDGLSPYYNLLYGTSTSVTGADVRGAGYTFIKIHLAPFGGPNAPFPVVEVTSLEFGATQDLAVPLKLEDAVRLGPPSVINSVQPGEAANGERVTVSGSALLGASAQLDGITLFPAAVDNSDDSMRPSFAMTPIHVNNTVLSFFVAGDPPPGEYDLELGRSDGTLLKCPACITVTAPPLTITAIEPPLGVPGGAITIRGTALEAGLVYADDTLKLDVLSSNDTTVVALLPDEPLAGVQISAQDALDRSASTAYKLLTIQALRPAMPQAGQPLELDVSNFAGEPSIAGVFVGGSSAPISSVVGTTITVDVPTGRFSNALATVAFNDGRNTSTTFTDPNALFEAVTPSVGVPGMTVTVTGDFSLDFLQNSADVELAGTQVEKVGATSKGRLVVTAGDYEGSEPPSGFVSVRLGFKDPDLFTLRYLPFAYAAPTVTGVSSRAAWASHEFSVYGTGLVTEEDSSISYKVILSYIMDLELVITHTSPTELRLRMPQQVEPYSEGSTILLYWNDAVASSLPQGPVVVHPPSLTHLSASSVTPGQLLTLFTSNVPLFFGVHVTVTVASEPAEIVGLHTNNITVAVPLNATGSGGGSAAVDLLVDGVSTNTPAEVSLGPAPRILHVSPSTVTQGMTVTLVGEGFDAAGIDPSTLRVGGHAVQVAFNSSSTIVFAMPPPPSENRFGLRQTLSVSIQAQALYGAPTITFPFEVTYTLAGEITAVAPSAWKTGDRITIKGHRFAAAGDPMPFSSASVLRASVGQQQLRVLEVRDGEVIVEALADGRVAGPSSDAPFALELRSGFMVFVAQDACRCPATRIGGVTWPGVVGCGELSRTPCRGEGVDTSAVAYRTCTEANRLSLAVNTSACVNRRLRDLSVIDVREDNVDDVLQELTNYTRNTPLFAPDDVRSSYHIIRNATKLLGSANLKRETFRLIFKSASDLLAVDGSVLEDTARQADVPVSSIPGIVEQWTDGVVDLLSDDEASVQAEENVVIVAYRFGALRSSFEGVANAVNSKCDQCAIAEASNTSEPLLIGARPVNYSIASNNVEGMAITLFRDSRLFAGGNVANPLQNTTGAADLGTNTTFVDSPVLSIQTRRAGAVTFEGEVRFSLPTNFYDANETVDARACSFWRVPTNPGESARWSDLGCSLVTDADGLITCTCNHLTNFAVLANYGGDSTGSISVHTEALSFITYVGVGISVFCLLMTLCVFLYYERLREDIGRIIVMHLSANLIVTLLVFAVGIERTGDADACTAIAIVLHYFLLSAFCWMLVEGYHLYVTFVTVFRQSSHSEHQQHVRYAAFAYGVPAIIVLITGLIIGEDGYGYEDACWLPTTNYEIWAFLGPMCLVIVINIGLFIAILRSILSVGVMNEDKAARQRLMRGLRASASFLTIMGVTWVFGALLFSGSLVLQYFFTIFNVLQGLFIFIFHCWWNASVRDALTGKSRRETVAYMRTKSSKFVHTGTSQGSHSQQSLLRHNSALTDNLRRLSGPREVNSLSMSEPHSSSTGQYLDLDPETMGGLAEDDEEDHEEEEETVMGERSVQGASLRSDGIALESVNPSPHLDVGNEANAEAVNSSSTEALHP